MFEDFAFHKSWCGEPLHCPFYNTILQVRHYRSDWCDLWQVTARGFFPHSPWSQVSLHQRPNCHGLSVVVLETGSGGKHSRTDNSSHTYFTNNLYSCCALWVQGGIVVNLPFSISLTSFCLLINMSGDDTNLKRMNHSYILSRETEFGTALVCLGRHPYLVTLPCPSFPVCLCTKN